MVHDPVTVNLYQLVRAALTLRTDRRVIAIASDDFPSDRYVVIAIARDTGCEVRHDVDRLGRGIGRSPLRSSRSSGNVVNVLDIVCESPVGR